MKTNSLQTQKKKKNFPLQSLSQNITEKFETQSENEVKFQRLKKALLSGSISIQAFDNYFFPSLPPSFPLPRFPSPYPSCIYGILKPVKPSHLHPNPSESHTSTLQNFVHPHTFKAIPLQ